MLATTGYNKEEYSREKLLANTLWIIITRESNNKYKKLQQHIKKRETRKKRKKKRKQAPEASTSASVEVNT